MAISTCTFLGSYHDITSPKNGMLVPWNKHLFLFSFRFTTFSTLLSVCRHWLGGCPVLQYLHLSLNRVPHMHFCEFCWMASKSLASLVLFSMLICTLCTSTLCIQARSYSLVASSVLSRVMTSLNIWSVIPSSFSLPTNCSVNNLLGSLYS